MKLEETIICPICGVRKVILNLHITKVHKMDPVKVMQKYNLESLSSPMYKMRAKERSMGKNNPFYGKRHSDESKEKMIQTRDGKSYQKVKPECGLCACGCGKRVLTPGSTYRRGHGINGLLVGDKNPARRPDVRRKLVKNHASRGPNAESRQRKITLSKIGKPRPDMLGDKNPAKRPEVRQLLSKYNAMKNPINVEKQVKSANRSPNSVEKRLFNIIQSIVPDSYFMNTNGEHLVVKGKVPDYVSVDKTKIIEMFGDYWHSKCITGIDEKQHEQERVSFFTNYGYLILIIWEKELNDIERLKEKIKVFHSKERFNDCNQSVSKIFETVEQSDLYGDIERQAEMTCPSPDGESNKCDIPLFATPTLVTSDLFAQKGFLSSAGFKVINAGMYTYGTITGLGT
jgi:very-short-patch-repair endonuclease